ncbi:MAG: amidase family protein, partial [Pseudomonadota bacterium]|nr:amidase family protein [Pseudomonadota bacterium]
MAEKSVNEMTAVEMVKAISAGETNCEEIVRANLFAIEAREDDVQAWVHVDAENAIASAKAMDAAGPKGPLFGLPVGFKDVIDTADMPTEYGSDIYPGNRPDVDAACVALVKEAGGVVFGKAVTTEFAFVNPNK